MDDVLPRLSPCRELCASIVGTELNARYSMVNGRSKREDIQDLTTEARQSGSIARKEEDFGSMDTNPSVAEGADTFIADETGRLNRLDQCQLGRSNANLPPSPNFQEDRQHSPGSSELPGQQEPAELVAYGPFHLGEETILPSSGGFLQMTARACPQTPKALVHSHCPTSQAHVEEICALSRIVNAEWIERMNGSSDISAQDIPLTQPKICEQGFQALERCFEGKFVHNLQDIIALVHVACAIAYHLHKNDASYRWDEFFQDLCLWQFALSSGSDQSLFLRAMDRLAYPGRLSNPSMGQADFSSAVNNKDSGEISAERATHNDKPVSHGKASVGVAGHPLRPTIGQNYHSRILAVLRNGVVMTDCSKFLDGRSSVTPADVLESDMVMQNSITMSFPSETKSGQ